MHINEKPQTAEDILAMVMNGAKSENMAEKCANCKRTRWCHNSKTSECATGKRHRVYGFTQFGPQKFTK